MDHLVKKLSEGRHPVEIDLRPDKSATALKQCIDNGYVHVKFPETRGGTVLGMSLETGGIDLSSADFQTGKGRIRLRGDLTLNYVRVQCVADIDLESLTGTGFLEPVESGVAAS